MQVYWDLFPAQLLPEFVAEKHGKLKVPQIHVLGTFKPWVSRLDFQFILRLGQRWLRRWLAVAVSGTPSMHYK